MYYYNKEGKTMISIKPPLADSVKESHPPSVVYYEYENPKVASYQHLISDHGFMESFSESVRGVFEKPQLTQDIIGINTAHGPVKIPEPLKPSYKVHVLGLGDVGGMMLTGFRLLGKELISEIGIYDLDDKKVQRFEYELNQIKSANEHDFPRVKGISSDKLFECDVFIFTASRGIPEVGSAIKDVRMYQLENNAKIIQTYVDQAVESKFKGMFMVVSDPVDLLCQRVLAYSKGGLLPQQIKGFGLGVMAARASYYARNHGQDSYDQVGRVFGPHGKALVVANDVYAYDDDLSKALTKKTVEANLDVRAVGYKPFIAPALSSAALAILDCLRGKPHYSTVFLNGIFFGCKNTQIFDQVFKGERHPLEDKLCARLQKTYEELKGFES